MLCVCICNVVFVIVVVVCLMLDGSGCLSLFCLPAICLNKIIGECASVCCAIWRSSVVFVFLYGWILPVPLISIVMLCFCDC